MEVVTVWRTKLFRLQSFPPKQSLQNKELQSYIQSKYQWTNKHLGQLSIPRRALHDTFFIPVVNTEIIKAASFDNEVLSHDIVISKGNY